MGRSWLRVQLSGAIALALLVAIASPCAARTSCSSPYPASPCFWSFLRRYPYYLPVRRDLIRSGYIPVKLQHDDRDSGKVFVRRFPETLDCFGADHTECHFVFERHGVKRPNRKKYLIVVTLGESPKGLGPRVLERRSPDKDDLRKLWIRRDLKHRGCEDDTLWLRDCEASWLRDVRLKEKPEPPAPPMPDLPPLPPSAR